MRDDQRVPCRVLIVDDHAGFRSWVQRFLESEGYEVVGAASDGNEAVVAAQALHPDLVLLDVQLPDRNGFDVAQELVTAAPNSSVVLVSTRAADSYRGRIADAPALGFLNKADLSPDSLAEMIGARA